jgi:hypothetical protein
MLSREMWKIWSKHLFLCLLFSLHPTIRPRTAPGVRLLDWCSLELPTARYFADFVAKGVRPTVHTVFLGMYRAIVEDDRATLDALRCARVGRFSHHAFFFTTHHTFFRVEYFSDMFSMYQRKKM